MTTTASASGNPIRAVTTRIGVKGDPGTNGTDGLGFNNVRQSLLDSPLLRLFAPNSLTAVSAGALTATRATTKKYVDRYGVVRTAAVDEIPEELAGFLIEGASTNYALYSDDFTNAVWVAGGTASGSINGTGPDDLTTASNVSLPAVNDQIIQDTGESSASRTFTASVWAKGTAGETTTLQISNGTDSVAGVEITLTADWARYQVSIDMSATAGTVSAGFLRIAPQTATVFQVWGFQVEELSGASSVMNTTASTVTRAADDITIAAQDNAPNTASEFSFICQVTPQAFQPAVSNYLFHIDNGETAETENTFAEFRNNVNNFLFRTADDAFINEVFGAISTKPASVAVVCSATEIKLYIDGTEQASITRTVTLANALTTLFIGRRRADLNQNFYGNVRDFRFYEFALNSFEADLLGGV